MPPAGPRAPGWTRPVPRSSRRSGRGQGKIPPVPAGQGKAEHTPRRRSRSFVQWGAPPGPAARGAHPCGWPTVTGWTRRRYGAAAPGGNAPEMHLQTDRKGAVARRWGADRLRRHLSARARRGLVLAHSGRDDRCRVGLPRCPALAGPARPPGPCSPRTPRDRGGRPRINNRPAIPLREMERLL